VTIRTPPFHSGTWANRTRNFSFVFFPHTQVCHWTISRWKKSAKNAGEASNWRHPSLWRTTDGRSFESDMAQCLKTLNT
jgi:hypothetical protein